MYIDLERLLSILIPSAIAILIGAMNYREHREDLKQSVNVAAQADLLAQYNRVVKERNVFEVRCIHYEQMCSVVPDLFGSDAIARIELAVRKKFSPQEEQNETA